MLSLQPYLFQEYFGVFKKVTDENDFILCHFKYGSTFIPVGLVSPAAAFVRPVNGGLAALADCALNLENQLGILTEKDVNKFQDTLFSDQGLGFGKIKLSIFMEQVSHLIHVTCTEDFEEAFNGLVEGH